MAARAYWSGQIRLALVSIPVEVFAATKAGAAIRFNQIHKPSGKRIAYEKVVPGIGPVDRADAGDDLFIGDALAAGLVDLVEADRRARLGGGEDLHGDRDEGKADLPRPIGACCHA